jgi:hypothetical protein
MPDKDLLSWDDALEQMAEGMLSIGNSVPDVGTFGEFVSKYWSQSYEKPEWFDTWHVQYLCNALEQAMSDGKHFCALVPRFHLKSTVLGYAFSIWTFLKNGNSRFASSGMYLSYSDSMSRYHIAEMQKAIRRNPALLEHMTDLVPTATQAFHYQIGRSRGDIIGGGIFSFKRGTHVNRFMVADDILKDPENPLNLGQIHKIEDQFMTALMPIPVGDAMVVCLGTPMAPDDLLMNLEHDERFVYVKLPALDGNYYDFDDKLMKPYRILCPEIRSEAALLYEQSVKPHSFASEMLLLPYLSQNAYLDDDQIKGVEDENLKGINPYTEHKELADVYEYIVAAVDIGKKRHPSHVVAFGARNGELIQIYQEFLDGWEYTDQVEFLNMVMDNLQVDIGYIDTTRGDMDERGLDSKWIPTVFTAKRKRQMAAAFEKWVNTGGLKLIKDDRQREQITSVNIDLQAPETAHGHGDSFWSNAMACLAYVEEYTNRTQDLGNMQDFVSTNVGNNGTKKVDMNYNKLHDNSLGKCPKCTAAEPAWIPENQLCLICGHRGEVT